MSALQFNEELYTIRPNILTLTIGCNRFSVFVALNKKGVSRNCLKKNESARERREGGNEGESL